MIDGVEAGLRVTNALDYLRVGGGEELRDYYLFATEQALSRLRLQDLRTSTLVSLLALIMPELSRIIGGRSDDGGDGVVLQLIRDGGAAGA